MMKHNNIIIGLLFLLTALSVSFGIYKYVIKHDYFVYLNPPCDPAGELSCFVYEEEGEVSEPYLKLYRKAYEVQACHEGGGCDPYVCRDDEECALITCDDDSVEEGESCAEPLPIDEIPS
jgi:hypothetical protein